MEILSLSQCKSTLDFQPLKPYPRVLPVYVWQGVRLGTGDPKATTGVQLDGQLPDILQALYPTLSFVEIVWLWAQVLKLDLPVHGDELWRLWGYRWSLSLEKIATVVLTTPNEFQRRAAEKSLVPRDLEPLLVDVDIDAELIQLSEAQVSKSELAQILELVVDLKMLGRPFRLIPGENCLAKLKAIRHPVRTEANRQSEIKTKALVWPKNSKWRWEESKDRRSLELQVSLKSLDDLSKLSRSIESLNLQLQKQGDDLWL